MGKYLSDSGAVNADSNDNYEQNEQTGDLALAELEGRTTIRSTAWRPHPSSYSSPGLML